MEDAAVQLSLDWVQALSSLVIIVATIIGGVWAMVQLSLSSKLDKFEVSLIEKLNGTYIRRGECELARTGERHELADLARRVEKLEQTA